MDKCCATCKHWCTNDILQRKYGEGHGWCYNCNVNDVTFCDKHNCSLYEKNIKCEDNTDA